MPGRIALLIVAALFAEPYVSADDFVPFAVIGDKRIDESSGIAISRTHDDAVWLHNDSGDKPRLFLVGVDGNTRAVVNVEDADAVDWEDMCSFEFDGQPWLLIADVGDNNARRDKDHSQCVLYLLKEPTVPPNDDKHRTTVDVRIRFEYEDGPHNCESVAVDVERQEILLLTKTAPLECRLYRMPLDLDDKRQSRKARQVASPAIPFATAIDISPDGRKMAIATMWSAVLVDRHPGQTWADAFQNIPTPLTLPPRRQGETVCFDRAGTFLYLNSEFPSQPLWRIKVPKSPEQ